MAIYRVKPVNVLVIYGSRWGGTAEAAKKIGLTLTQEGCTVEVINAKKPKKNSSHLTYFLLAEACELTNGLKKL
jgi:menaquinone-dependent protoporphyrinogen IX oxidase